jgi:pimeloyl-ACP methyl ester carboxylesterase
MLRIAAFSLLMFTLHGALAQSPGVQSPSPCGTVVHMESLHGSGTTRYSWMPGRATDAGDSAIALILLIGGGGTLDLDDAGCPQRLNHNILVRSAPLFQAAGMSTVLVDAPANWSTGDGLAGFRMQGGHAQDLGQVIADVRIRTGATAVWVVGHSRGTLSAANAAARLSGSSAPDGVVLASAMLWGEVSKRKPWVAQTVLDADLTVYRGAILMVGHAADNCARSPPQRMDAAVQGANASRLQVVRVTGGPRSPGRAADLSSCEVGQAHDFVDQDRVFVDGVVRFVRGGRF